ncbi:MAG: pro-sigmaK processing inhibitor BofA family protein [Acetatifactor sp.]|nr:pro-sigmaK processing inhibitor BofA family protein [Acetatifactor sp.]
MGNETGVLLITVACGTVLLIGVMRKRVEWLLNVFMRGILGTVGMYFINSALATAGISLGVGINAVTVLTSGILGLPGLVALYGLGIYKLL